MLSKKMLDALNAQINAELYSSYLYLSMAACFQSLNLPGAAKWMKVQAREENTHAMKIFQYVEDRLSPVTLAAIGAPPTKWKSALAAFQDAFRHEQKVTGMIHDLVALARAEKDPATEVFLQWFVNEQVEEEASADQIVQQLKMAGESPSVLLMLDQVLGQRQ